MLQLFFVDVAELFDDFIFAATLLLNVLSLVCGVVGCGTIGYDVVGCDVVFTVDTRDEKSPLQWCRSPLSLYVSHQCCHTRNSNRCSEPVVFYAINLYVHELNFSVSKYSVPRFCIYCNLLNIYIHVFFQLMYMYHNRNYLVIKKEQYV